MGLDISTSTIGIFIVEYDNDKQNVLYYDYYKPNKKVTELERLKLAQDHIINIAERFNVDEFAVEDFIRFMKGKSKAGTIISLAIMNRSICLAIYKKFGVYPNILNVLKIRHTIKTGKELPKKEDIPTLLSHHLNISFPLFTKKYKGEEIFINENYDVADAGSCAYCHILLQRGNNGNKKHKKDKN